MHGREGVMYMHTELGKKTLALIDELFTDRMQTENCDHTILNGQPTARRRPAPT